MRNFINIGQLSHNYYKFDSHVHNCWEICYYISGSGTNTIGGAVVPFRENVIICQPPNVAHEEISLEGYRNFYFTLEYMYNFGMEIPVFYDGPENECLQIIQQLLYVFHKQGHNWRSVAEATLALLTEYFISYVKYRKSPEVEFFEKLLIDNLDNSDFILADHIHKMPFSDTYFMKLFKKETGYTPNEYLVIKRIEHAKRILTSGSAIRVKDVAELCGFKDAFYFSRVFKKITGNPPSNLIPVAGDKSL